MLYGIVHQKAANTRSICDKMADIWKLLKCTPTTGFFPSSTWFCDSVGETIGNARAYRRIKSNVR